MVTDKALSSNTPRTVKLLLKNYFILLKMEDFIQREIHIIHERLNNQAAAIKVLFERFEEVNAPLVTPMDPQNVKLETDILTFELGNAKFLEFVDIKIDNGIFEQFWASWTDRDNKFKIEDNLVTVQLFLVPTKSLEIFTRYDKFTKNSNAGRATLTL
jgi:hypothetical protein